MDFEAMNHCSAVAGDRKVAVDCEAALYTELWRACAGPHVIVPREGERVFYFPQGHIEQVKATTNQASDESDQDMPDNNLPSKVLCRVINVQLMVEPVTDEVFARVTLLPLKEDGNEVDKEPVPPLPPSFRVHSFCKTLTPSDANSHGGFSVHKQHGDECLPPLDTSLENPTQELVAKDLHGKEWHFGHVYRGTPKRHLLQSGWSFFVSSKRLVAGDAFIFLRGENEELRVGVRRAMRQQGNVPSPVISSHSMHLGVLEMARHAFTTGTFFTVYYYPRISPAEFIVPFDRYMESVERDYSIGMRFKTRFVGEEAPEQSDRVSFPNRRFTGTIVGIEDVDSKRWPESKWGCLKVRWDKTSTILHPERVSPWKVEPALTSPALSAPLPRSKRLRPNMLPSSPDSAVLTREGFGTRTSSSDEFSAASGDQTPCAPNSMELNLPNQEEKYKSFARYLSIIPSVSSLNLLEARDGRCCPGFIGYSQNAEQQQGNWARQLPLPSYLPSAPQVTEWIPKPLLVHQNEAAQPKDVKIFGTLFKTNPVTPESALSHQSTSQKNLETDQRLEQRNEQRDFVGTEQILLGLIGEGTGVAAKFLKSMGINLKDARIDVEKISGQGSGTVSVEIPFNPRAKRVLELSLVEAHQLGHSYIGSEHLLLGLLREGEGMAVKILESLGADPNSIRTQVIRMVGESSESAGTGFGGGSSGNKKPTLDEK